MDILQARLIYDQVNGSALPPDEAISRFAAVTTVSEEEVIEACALALAEEVEAQITND